jgi:hypothetical protein
MTSVTISVLEKPIERIRETCEMMGAADKFERALGELETYLEEEVASGETQTSLRQTLRRQRRRGLSGGREVHD